MPNPTLGQTIREFRDAAGLTLAEAALRARIGKGTLWHWEQDRQEPGFKGMQRLARVLGRPLCDFDVIRR